MKRKLIAILCVFSIVAGMFHALTTASVTQASEGTDEVQFEELTLGHFGAIDRPYGGTKALTYSPYGKSKDSLDKVAVTGIYNFKFDESYLFIGGNYVGLQIRSQYQKDKLQILYSDKDENGTNVQKTLCTIEASELNGNSPVDRNVKIRTTFSFANVSDDKKTADITIGVEVDDIYTYSVTITGYTEHFCKMLTVDKTLKYASYDQNVYDVVTLDDLSAYKPGIVTAETKYGEWNSGLTSLKNQAIEGYFTFSSSATASKDNAISFGRSSIIKIGTTTNGNLNIYTGSSTLDTVTSEKLGLSTLRNTELHIRVTFSYIKETETTADVQVGIDIGGKGTLYYIIKEHKINQLRQCITVTASEDYHITHKTTTNMDYKISDFSSEGADNAFAERTTNEPQYTTYLNKLAGQYKIGKDIDTATVEGYYNFESTGADSTSAVYYGSRKAGICISPNKEDNLEVSYVNGEGKRTDVGVIRAEEAGFALTNRYIKIKTILSVQASVNDTRTVVVGIIVEDPSVEVAKRIPYRKAFKLQNVSNSHLDTVMSLWAKQKVTVSDHILAPTHLVDIIPSDFNIADNVKTSGPLKNNTNDSGNQKISFDGKVFSVNVQFNPTNGSGWIRLGGKQAEEGIGFGVWKDNTSFQFRKDGTQYTLGTQNLVFSKTGLSQVTESFNLKISIEFVDLDSNGGKNDVRYGLYFNNKLYDDQFFYTYNDRDAFGDYLQITGNGVVQCESLMRSSNDNVAPYILEDFGVEAKEYKTTDEKTSYKATIQMGDMEKNSISGKVALDTKGKIYFYGNASVNGCFYLCAEYGEVVQLLGNTNFAQTKGFATGTLGVKPGEEFTFTLSKETLDADSDGLKDDVRLGIWINNQLHKNKYFYFTDLAQSMDSSIYLNYKDDNITVKDTLDTIYKDLSAGEAYQVTGYGNLTKNGETVEHGQNIDQVGDYTVRSTDYDTYVELVSVYKPGDTHLDGTFTVQDIVAMTKAKNNVKLNTKAAQKAADYDKNGTVDDLDCDGLRSLLLEEAEDENVVASFTFEENVMPIMGGSAPYRTVVTREDGNTYTFDLINDNSYRLLKEAGINLITSGSGDFFSRASDKMCLTA